MHARLVALERELEGMRELPEQLARLQEEKRTLARRLARHERAENRKPIIRGGDASSGRADASRGWGVPALIFGFYPALISAASIADGTLLFDEGDLESVPSVQALEWAASLGFLLMGVSLIIIGVALLLARSWAAPAQDCWAIASTSFVVAVMAAIHIATGRDAWVFGVHLMYPLFVLGVWIVRRVATR